MTPRPTPRHRERLARVKVENAIARFARDWADYEQSPAWVRKQDKSWDALINHLSAYARAIRASAKEK